MKREEQFTLICLMHFPCLGSAGSQKQFDKMVKTLSCTVCDDKNAGECTGRGLKGVKVMDCMNEKLNDGEFGIIGNGKIFG
ncbi:hypothetical protein SBDP1_200019 [Syntrophobacter sp. SbD1]|nr:hypothetical protein SBDP1_200019 [Syntrophobacter sp. SbD1]